MAVRSPLTLRFSFVAIAFFLVFVGHSADTAALDLRTCVRIQNVTVFQPRGEVYVEIDASCSSDDFENDEEIVVFVEVLVNELPPVTEDFRVSALEPRRRQTFVFDELVLEKGDPVLVRLMRSGDVVGLKSVKVP